jgi:hypothetical protein
MKTAILEIQGALYTRLNGNLTDCPVYVHVPKEHSYPYAVIHEPFSNSDSTKGCLGEIITQVIHIWDSQGDIAGSNRKIVNAHNEIMALVTTSFDSVQNFLTLTGFTVIRQDFAGFQVVDNITDAIRHGVLTIEFMVEET